LDSKAVVTARKPWSGADRLHLGFIVCLFIVITAYHYSYLWSSSDYLLFGMTRHAVDRVFFLLPVIYANYVFGRSGGLYATAAAFLTMIPRALLFSEYRPDAVAETLIVVAVGVASSLWLNLGRKQKLELEATMRRVGRMRDELETQTRVISDQQKRLATFTAFSAALSQSLEVSQVIHTGVNMVMEALRVEVVLIFTLDEEKGELKLVSLEGLSRNVAEAIDRIKIGEGFSGRVAETGQPMMVDDISEDPRLSRLIVRDEKLKASAIVPLVARGRIVGTLSVATRRSRKFEAAEIELLAAVGNQIGVAMENSRLYQEQARIVEQLRLSEERFRQLFENAHDAIWLQDLSGRNIAANDAAAQLIGYRHGSDIVGKDVRDFIPPESMTLARELREKLARGESVEQPYEQKLIRRDGSEVILKVTTNLLTSNGLPIGFQHIARDITTERRLQENMRYYVQQITEAQEEEATRIARELHDVTLQSLIALVHQLENFCQEQPVAAELDSGFLRNLREKLRQVVQEIRAFSRDLRPSILDDLGLLPSVEFLVEELQRTSRVKGEFEVVGTERRFPPATEVALFRIIQEALRNIVKHSSATHAEVTVEFRDTETVVTVADNGVGFAAPRSLSELPRTGKLGLLGMQERARLVGARLDISSSPGQGAILMVTLPEESV
jgi:PAS domain S-box-containing protein